MLDILRHRTYRHLFGAQVVSLLGTGMATVALGLLAYDLAGDDAGAVLGTALAIKMIAYVTLAPVAAVAAGRLPRRAFLVGLDLIRAVVVLGLPFVTAIWQVYVLVALLQAASVGFTPAFQATIPDVLPEERDYTRALSLSQLASDFETLLSPLLAAALLTVASFEVLFVGTFVGFVLSALLVVSVRLPDRAPAPEEESTWHATTKGIRIMLRTPRLRGSLALEMAVAAAGAMVLVSTVVLVEGAGQTGLATGLAVAGVDLAVVARAPTPARPEGLAGGTGEGVRGRVVAERLLGKEALADGRASHRLGHVGGDPRRLAGLDVFDLEVAPVSDGFDPLHPKRLHGDRRRGRQQSHVDDLAVDLLFDDQLVLHVDGDLDIVAHAHLGHSGHGPAVGIG